MGTHEPTGRPEGQESGRTSQEDAHAQVLSPSPSEYLVEVAFPRSPWLDFHFRSPTQAPSSPPPVPAPRVPGQDASVREGERAVVSVQLSFARSAEVIWKLVSPGNDILLALAALVLIGLAWCVVLSWCLIWGIFLVPYRLLKQARARAS